MQTWKNRVNYVINSALPGFGSLNRVMVSVDVEQIVSIQAFYRCFIAAGVQMSMDFLHRHHNWLTVESVSVEPFSLPWYFLRNNGMDFDLYGYLACKLHPAAVTDKIEFLAINEYWNPIEFERERRLLSRDYIDQQSWL